MQHIIQFLIVVVVTLSVFNVTGWAGVPNPQGFQIGIPESPAIPTTTSISQYGVTWTFSEPVKYGQFVNGDYWVVDPGSGVIVINVSPASSSAPDVRNGSMKNPIVDGTQCLDSRAYSFNSANCLNAPFTLFHNDSLISSISKESFSSDWNGGAVDSHTFVGVAAILTVVSSAPPAGSFRPAYVDRNQTLYNISNLNLSKLPGLTPSASPPHEVSYYERGLERPWLLFQNNYTGRAIHAFQNMFEYHREIGEFLSEFTLLMMTSQADMETAIMRFCQLGIDYYHIGKQGEGDSSYWVPPVLYTGILLNNIDMQNFFSNGQLKAVPRDYPDFYYWDDHQSTIKSSIVPEGKTWTGSTVFFRNQIGGGEHEHLHPSEWDKPTEIDHWKNDVYRRGIDSFQHVGMVLSAILFGNNAKQLWGHNATFDYIDRWMSEDLHAECLILEEHDDTTDYGVTCGGPYTKGGSAFIDSMWLTYRN